MTTELANDQARLTIDDICERCGLSQATITTYVEEGLLEVSGSDARSWKFSHNHIVHLQKAHRLETDLGLNPAGLALVLELKAEIEHLKAQLRQYQDV